MRPFAFRHPNLFAFMICAMAIASVAFAWRAAVAGEDLLGVFTAFGVGWFTACILTMVSGITRR